MKRSLLACAALAVAAALPSAAAADEQGTTFSITETLVGEWLWDNGNGRNDDDYYWDIKNRLNIGMLADGIDVGLRIDTATFRFLYPSWMGDESTEQRQARETAWCLRQGQTPDAQGDCGTVGDYRLERIFAKVRLAPDWQLTGGDFYASLGRGLLLSLRKDDELGIDSALRGGRVDGRIADRIALTLMGGLVNVNNVDERFNLIAEDPLDVIAAGSVGVDLWGSNRLSAHVMNFAPHSRDAPFDDLVGYGGTLELLDLPADLKVVAEVDGLHRELPSGTDDDFGAYVDASGVFGPVQVGLEYKEYHDFDVFGSGVDATGVRWPYNRPPTADLEDQLIESEFDNRGGRLKLDFKATDWLTLFAACAGAQDFSDAGHDDVHPYGGFEITWDDGQSVLRGVAGYRRTWQTLVDGTTDWYRTLVHARIDLSVHLWGPLSMQAEVLHEEWSQAGIVQTLDYRRGTTALSIDWAGIGGIFGTFEYDTENPHIKEYFGAGGLQWFAADWLTVRGRAGSQRGGRKCIAGVCRDFPPFNGARLELIFRL